MGHEKKRHASQMVDIVSFGVLLIALGFVWSQNINLPSRIIAFFRSIEVYQNLPPYSVFSDVYDAFVLFVYILGAWSFLLAAIKIPLGLGVSSALSSALGGVFLFALGYLIREYYSGKLGLTTIAATLLVLAGLTIIGTTLLREVWKRKTH